ncbi:hypothetical protein IAD21_06378 [Abditibacteriota bacterium]|nr:hypothetical protein IAD21_06378 [Abditibacteriota bacterium]
MDVDFQVRCIATAFGTDDSAPMRTQFSTGNSQLTFQLGDCGELIWQRSPRADITGIDYFVLKTQGTTLSYSPKEGVSRWWNDHEHAMAMARALFKLGRPIVKLEERFGPLLTIHDKFALREEMPLEFWPECWKMGEVRRIAAAFEVAECVEVEYEPSPDMPVVYYMVGVERELHWQYHSENGHELFTLGTRPQSLEYSTRFGIGRKAQSPQHAVWMAKALFKLGQSIEKLEDHFGPLLSFHDKIQCSEEIPREFWPQKWLDGEFG